jgi:hypothetical protein
MVKWSPTSEVHGVQCSARAEYPEVVRGTRPGRKSRARVACTTDEATELIELGFEYVNEINGRHLYRKKK